MRPSWPTLSRARAVVLVFALVALMGCEQSGVSVRSSGKGAYGRPELLAAIERYHQSDRSPEQFHELATAIASLDARFDENVRTEAERHLVILALAPLAALAERSSRERLDALGLTVWPTALGTAPEPDESAWRYGERLCSGALALECKYVVPEYRALVLDALVWERFQERAYDAVRSCDSCVGDATYRKALDSYDRHLRKIRSQVEGRRSLFEPGRWPTAGDHASAWSDAILLEIRKSGAHVLDGRPLGAGELPSALRDARAEHQRLGVLIRASAPISELRTALNDARTAGFYDVVLQVRYPVYPFELAQYSLTTNPGGEAIPVRDIDTIQVLVQALDVAAESSESAPRI